MSDIEYQYYGADDDEHARVSFWMTNFHQRRTRRVNFENNWEENAALAAPEYRNSFTFGRDNAPGVKRAQYQLDSSMQVASFRFASIVDWLVTPQAMMWSKVGIADDNGREHELMKDRTVKVWAQQITETLWCNRYKPRANFVGQNAQNMRGTGLFGNMCMFTDEIDDYLDIGDRGPRYKAIPVGEMYVIRDHQGCVVGGIRHFRLNAQQAKTKFKNKVIPQIEAALSVSSQTLFDFLHFVVPRTDYNPFERLTKKRFRYQSFYISVQGHCIMEEGGYRTLPMAYACYMMEPDAEYGFGPTDMARPSAKTKNAEKRVFLKQGHRAGDPAYLVADTGLVDLKQHPGAINAGMMTRDGKPLVGVMPTGTIQITEEMMTMEDNYINSCYLVDLFKMILEDPKSMSNAQQVVEYVQERGVILFPTIGRQNSEYLGPLIDRELDILASLCKLPPLPAILREAKGEFKIEYTNPIALAMRGQKTAGLMRTVGIFNGAIQAGADPGIIDILDFEVAGPEIGDDNFVPANWFTAPKKLAAIKQAKAKQQQQENYIKSLPGLAARDKAQAIVAKAQTGGNIGGTLSGTPPGGMPMMPGQQ